MQVIVKIKGDENDADYQYSTHKVDLNDIFLKENSIYGEHPAYTWIEFLETLGNVLEVEFDSREHHWRRSEYNRPEQAVKLCMLMASRINQALLISLSDDDFEVVQDIFTDWVNENTDVIWTIDTYKEMYEDCFDDEKLLDASYKVYVAYAEMYKYIDDLVPYTDAGGIHSFVSIEWHPIIQSNVIYKGY